VGRGKHGVVKKLKIVKQNRKNMNFRDEMKVELVRTKKIHTEKWR